ncbi:MAG: PqqD family protein [Thaumarchaeota archaeon]|nr:PqqD family protein [Nitrososphaerota archaeon]
MEPERLSKKGQASQTTAGEMVLVNDKGIAYKVSESVVVVWDSFQGNTTGEVVEEIAANSSKSPDQIREPIEDLVFKLKEAELLV